MGHGWVILVRRTREREHALVEKVVKVKRAGVALSVLSHEQEVCTREVVQMVPSCLKRLAGAAADARIPEVPDMPRQLHALRPVPYRERTYLLVQFFAAFIGRHR
jgi:hypothetical protein